MKKITKFLERRILYCLSCHYQSIIYSLNDFSYGEFLGRSSGNDLIYLNAFDDKVIDELSDLIKNLRNEKYLNNNIEKLLGYTCDPSQSGEVYSFIEESLCPRCHSPNIQNLKDEKMPVEEKTLNIATHDYWDQLSSCEKLRIIEKIN